MRNNQSVSIILPCYNEGRTIAENITVIADYMDSSLFNYEIIAVDNGSSDNTLGVLKEIRKNKKIPLRIFHQKRNEGKGAAVKEGVLGSNNDIVMFLDADLAIPIQELPKFLIEIEKGSDVVIASRFIAKIKILKPVLWYRSIMEKIFRILRMVIINNYKIKDTQCGFKVFTRQSALKIFSLLTIKRFSFDAEVIFLASKMGCKIKELPITLQNPRESHVRLISDSWNMFWDLTKIRLNNWNGKYKI